MQFRDDPALQPLEIGGIIITGEGHCSRPGRFLARVGGEFITGSSCRWPDNRCFEEVRQAGDPLGFHPRQPARGTNIAQRTGHGGLRRPDLHPVVFSVKCVTLVSRPAHCGGQGKRE